MTIKRLMGAGVLGASLTGILLGLILILTPAELLLKAIFLIVGIVTILGSLPGLLVGWTTIATPIGKLAFVSSLISLILGFLMIFLRSNLILIVVGVYLLALPILNIILSKGKGWKAELPKMVIGVVLVLIGPEQTFAMMLDVAGWAVLALTACFLIGVAIRAIRGGARAQKASEQTGNRVFVDNDGDGSVDQVYVDTTGDGKPDTAMRYKDSK